MDARLVTAVALYGPKSGALKELLETVQAICRERLGAAFRPYSLGQIHGTVIRLDGTMDAERGVVVNQRYRQITGTAPAADLARALTILGAHLTPPLRIRIGGYGPGTTAPFTSRGEHPHERMFSLQGDAFVLVGWPASTVVNGISARPLDRLRRRMNDAGIWHWYHRSGDDIDNDLHLVIGHHNGTPGPGAWQAVRAVRGYLASRPAEIEVGTGQIAIIAARSPTLVPADFIGRLPADPAQIASLYR